MKGYVVYPDGTCGFDELPMPKYDAYSALVKMESCGFAMERYEDHPSEV